MSNARICDIDGTIFAEGAEGSQVLSGQAMEFNSRSGRVEPVSKAMDVCPKCAGGAGPVTPRLAVNGPEAAHDVQVVDDPAEAYPRAKYASPDELIEGFPGAPPLRDPDPSRTPMARRTLADERPIF